MGSRTNIPDDYVRIAKCRMCGGDTNAILLHKQLKSIPKDQAYDTNPCDGCKERLKTMVYFMGECGHAGFVKDHVFSERVSPPKLLNDILKKRICRMEKCFVCMNGQDIKDFETI